jgi:hypothetical protein
VPRRADGQRRQHRGAVEGLLEPVGRACPDGGRLRAWRAAAKLAGCWLSWRCPGFWQLKAQLKARFRGTKRGRKMRRPAGTRRRRIIPGSAPEDRCSRTLAPPGFAPTGLDRFGRRECRRYLMERLRGASSGGPHPPRRVHGTGGAPARPRRSRLDGHVREAGRSGLSCGAPPNGEDAAGRNVTALPPWTNAGALLAGLTATLGLVRFRPNPAARRPSRMGRTA